MTPTVIDIAVGELTQLPPVEMLDALQHRGAVHIRGGEASSDEFARFGDLFSSSFTCDPHKVVATSWTGAPGLAGQIGRRVNRARARRAPADTAAARFAPFSGYGLNPHNENCYLPAAFPDLVWFHCSRPAAEGGHTVLVDGTELLDALTEPSRRFLRDEPIRYTTTLERPQWEAAWGIDGEHDLRALLDDAPGAAYSLADSGRLELTFDTTQVASRRFDDADAVRSNVLSRQPFDGINVDTVEPMASGEPIPIEVLRDLSAAARRRIEVPLAAGDVLLLDNSRVLHGRTPFDDERRRVETRCAWLDPALEPRQPN